MAIPVILLAAVHTLTLAEAARRALAENPDVVLARLDEQSAAQRVTLARDPFVPKVFAGSGLAYSHGFPMSIDGAAPSVVQARAVASVYNRQQRLQIEQAREEARGAGFASRTRSQQAVARTVQLFLEAEHKELAAGAARRQIESSRKVAAIVDLRVAEGREIPLESKRAALEAARAEQRLGILESDRDAAQAMLAVVLGYPDGDRVRPAGEQRAAADLPLAEEDAIARALADHPELRRLESALAAKNLEMRAHAASRYPRFDLVAQYGLLARFNNYEDFFRRFQRHNGQIGVSAQIPILAGPASRALASQAGIEAARLRIEVSRVRAQVRMDIEKGFRELRKAETARKVARLDLDVAREALSVHLARMEEGRSTLRQVEEARIGEQEKWMVYYDAQYQVESARWALLERAGGIMAALQ